MGFSLWVAHNWFDVLQTVAIVASFSTTVYTVNQDRRARRVAHAIEITKGHRELWTHFADRPDLRRVFDSNPKRTVSRKESVFINQLILHLKLVYRASDLRLYDQPEGLRHDIRDFFSNPKPRMVWEKNKNMHDATFVAFVEDCLQKDK